MSRDTKSNYYDAGGIETLDVIKAKLTPEQFRGYLLGNALKYSCRMMHKGDPTRDAEKAANYSAWLRDAQGEAFTGLEALGAPTVTTYDGTPLKCPGCGWIEFAQEDSDVDDPMVRCENCGKKHHASFLASKRVEEYKWKAAEERAIRDAMLDLGDPTHSFETTNEDGDPIRIAVTVTPA